ncbi:MAG: DUF222 domain-containing protein [Streptosporangiaceae bacterium]
MAAELAEPHGPDGADAPFRAALAAATTAVASLVAAASRLGEVADEDLTPVMRSLTTLVGELDGVRVAVTRQVRDRGVFRREGASSVTGWLRADVRTADVAASLSQLAAHAADLPKVTDLLAGGQVSLAQASTACWQITRLPDSPTPPDQEPSPSGPDAPDTPGGPDAANAPGTPDGPGTSGDPAAEDDRWAGLWRCGDLHAAADELFAGFMPRLDGEQLRALGAHLREAADARERAAEDYNAYARRSLRLSRGFAGAGELSGRLHPEAAAQVLAAFEELGTKAGPDDPRTKAQRWADVLIYLTSLAVPAPAPAPAPPGPGGSGPDAQPSPDAAPYPTPSPDATPRPHAAPNPDAALHPTPSPDSAPYPHPAPGADGASGAGAGVAGQAAADDDQPSPDGGHGHPAAARPGGAGAAGVAPVGLRRPRVIVTVPLATLLGQPLAPGAVLGAGTPITGEAARRLACDADIIRLITTPPSRHLSPPGYGLGPPGQDAGPPGQDLGPPGQGWSARDATGLLADLLAGVIAALPRPLGGPSAALDTGRASQSWTPRQRDTLYALYGGRCGAPGCTNPIDVLHHIVHWAQGGPTSVANGAPFCLSHHWLVHEGGWQVTKDPTGALVLIPPPPGWQPGTIYRRGKPLPESGPASPAA